ncbi:histidine kinase [Pontibacter sp. G13]|uniref:tetratricopeptide repeat-containing sensor histidine kinase n=1 Tax=Pontibacter sp. G13 TaxID=3074898 RepID=UPI00288A1AC0|nr:histidine kinase [Pontibacter sp. G13]WNJ15941.1 histidine kinase [Pontibacter sp. G13]
MNRFWLCIFLAGWCLIVPVDLYGQSAETSTRATYSKKGRVVSSNVNHLYEYAAEQFGQDPTQAFDALEEALQIGVESNDRSIQAESYLRLGGFNLQLQRYPTAEIQTDQALKLLRKLRNPQKLFEAQLQMGAIYKASGNSRKALKSYQSALPFAQKQGNTQQHVQTLIAIGEIQLEMMDLDDAEKSFQMVLQLETSRKNEAGVASANTYLGDVNALRGQEEQALGNYKMALNTNAQDEEQLRNSLDRVDQSYRSRKQNRSAIDFRQEIQQVADSIGGYERLSTDNRNKLGELYLEEDESEDAIEQFSYGLEAAQEAGELEEQQAAFTGLASAYEKMGDLDRAVANLRAANTINDSLLFRRETDFKSTQSLLAELSVRDQRIATIKQNQLNQETLLELQDQKLETQRAQLARQKTLMRALASGLVVLMISGVFIIRSYRSKRRANQLLALKSLRSQMNPHFIFNSLNSINSFISRQDERSANKYLADFSKLMRAVMENSEHDFVPLNTELHVLRLYVGLEHFRFQDKFDFEFEVSDEIDIDELDIPPMLVQPYIENAVWHGLRYLPEKGHLSVHFSQTDKNLIVEIVDNGIGREKSQALKTKNQRAQKSTGIRNTQSRLAIIKELYSWEVKVEISDAFPDTDHVGTRVVIHLPLHTHS